MKKKLSVRIRPRTRNVDQNKADPQEHVYGGGGTKGLQAVGDFLPGGFGNLQGSNFNPQGDNKLRANDDFYLTTGKKVKVKKK